MSSTSRSVSGSLLPVASIVMLGFFAVALPLPALSLYLHGELGMDTFIVGVVVGVQSIATVITRPHAGRYCDRYGPRSSVLLGLPLAAFAGLLYLAHMHIDAVSASVAVLLAGRLLMGVAESLFLTGCVTWGIARVGTQHTGRVLAWQGVAMFTAYGVGAPLGIAVMEHSGFVGVSLWAAGLPLVAIAVALALSAPPDARSAQDSRAIGQVSFAQAIVRVWRPGLAMSLGSMAFVAVSTFMVLYFQQKGWSGAGLAVMLFSASYIGVRLVAAHFPDRYGGWIVALVSVAFEICGLLLLWMAPTIEVAFAGSVLTGAGLSLVFPSMGVEATRNVEPAARGVVMGTFLAFWDVSNAVTGPLLGAVIALWGYSSIFGLAIVCCLVAITLMFLGYQQARRGMDDGRLNA